MVDSFAERVERAVDARVDQQLAMHRGSSWRDDDRDSKRLALAIVSLGVSVPLTVLLPQEAGLAGIVTTWVGVVGVNLSYAVRGRRRR